MNNFKSFILWINVFENTFTVCSAGFFGNDCIIQCRFPSFGFQCQSQCNCSKENCNHVIGCNESSTICNSEEGNTLQAMMYSTVVLSVLAILQISIYLYFSLYFSSATQLNMSYTWLNTVYQVFSAYVQFPLCSRRFPTRGK